MENKLNISLEDIATHLSVHVYWLDRNNVFLGCNDLQATQAGLSKHEMIGKTNYDMPWYAHADVLNTTNNQVMKSGQEKVLEEIMILDGIERIYLAKKGPLLDNKANIIGRLGISFDITKQKEVERKLIEANEQAKATNNVKTEFLRDIHHDISRLNLVKENVHKFDKILFTSLRVIAGISLTIRETQCVCLWLSGYSIKYTSKVLSISNKTVETHRANILSKLGLFNKDQLISLVMAENTFHQYVSYTKKYIR